MVPHTWSVIQERDIIPQAAKLGFLYKRPGARVIVDGRGTLVVQPTPLDLHVQPREPPASQAHANFLLRRKQAQMQPPHAAP
jgi:hypothetical protein